VLCVVAVALCAAVIVSRFAFGGRGDVLLKPLWGGPAIKLVEQPLYARNDPWRAYLADEATCPGGESVARPLVLQVRTVVCLINFARARRGVAALPVSSTLSQTAQLKGEEIQRCRVFAHAPCGGDPGDVTVAVGYHGAFGENLYIADGRFAAPRVAVDQWLNSSGHRENLFSPRWRVQSVYVARLPAFREYRNASLWVSHFGDG
jgi:uncharacterized protein YkwD